MGTFALSAPTTAGFSTGWLSSLKTRAIRYRLYRQTLNALADLDARQLDDLGLTRDMLKRVAYQAAQEAR